MFAFSPSPRTRPTAFHDSIVADGVRGFSVYNHMCLPSSFGDPEAEYWRLINGVALWDVSAQRQVEITGPDAFDLVQTLSCRDLSKCAVGQGKYTPMCNRAGTLVNDPIVLKLADDHYWISIADSDMKLMAEGIAYAKGLNVSIREPDVSPLALQGPKAVEVVAQVFGDWVRTLGYFWFKETQVEGIPVVVQRSGWSKQGGYEIYLRDGTKAAQLYSIMKEAGKAWDIGPGNPNGIERIESGLISVGTDTDDDTNPFEVRLQRFVDLDIDHPVIGLDALRDIRAQGPKRQMLGVVFDKTSINPGSNRNGDTVINRSNESSGRGGDGGEASLNPLPYTNIRWLDVNANGKRVGHVTATAYSPRLGKTIGLALVGREWAKLGDSIEIAQDSGATTIGGTLVDIPFI